MGDTADCGTCPFVQSLHFQTQWTVLSPCESGFLVASDRNPPQTGLSKKKKAIKYHPLPPTSVILPVACLTGGSGPHWGTMVPSKAVSERNRGSSGWIVPTETPG